MRFLDGVLTILYALMTTLGMIGLKRALLADGSLLLQSWDQVLPLAGAAVLYFLGLGLWTVTLARNQLSIAYPIGIGLSLLSITLGGHWAFEEGLTLSKLAGGSFILLGALLISRSRT